MTTTMKRVLIALLVALLVYFAYTQFVSAPASVATSNVATTTLQEVGTTSPQVTISEQGMKIVQPAIDTPIKFGKNITADERKLINAKLDELRSVLRENKYDFTVWAALGTVYKIGGDYQRALAIWDYVGKAWPNNFVSFGNTGDLYANYLKDYAKAEQNYLRAIQNNATDGNVYRNLFTLYTETSYKPTNTAAEDLVSQYLANAPKAFDMQVLLARYYVKIGKRDIAKTVFETAALNAESQGKQDVARDIRAEALKLGL